MGETMQANSILGQYKRPNGAVDYPKVFQIPSWERLVALKQLDYTRLNVLIIAALTVAFEAMNLKRGMNEMQILLTAETIIDSAHEDNLSLEDVILFLQNVIKGKYQLSFESMDVPKFMQLFEIYRQERHSAYLEYNYNQHLQFKSTGDATRTASEDPLSKHFSNFADTISELKSTLRYQKKEINTIKQAEKFYGDKNM